MIDLTFSSCALQVINGLIEALVSVRRLQKYVSPSASVAQHAALASQMP